MSPVDRVDVTVLDADSRSKTAHDRAAELVREQRRLSDRIDAFFREVGEVRELLREERSLWDGPVLDPPVEAAFGVWSSVGPREQRIEIERLGPVPMMEVELPELRSPDETGYGNGP